MYEIKAYPDLPEFITVAKALVKYPCLQDASTKSGYDGWTNSLVFKMGNYRNEMRKAGGKEVKVNGNCKLRYNNELPGSAQAIKKPKRGEANYLPNFPQGEDAGSMEQVRKSLEQEGQNVDKDKNHVHVCMAKTFAARRQEVVCEMPRVATMLSRWPMLFDPSEVCLSLCLLLFLLVNCVCRRYLTNWTQTASVFL